MVHEFNAAKLRGVIGSVKSSHENIKLAKVREDSTISYWLNWGSGEMCLGVFNIVDEEKMDELVVQEDL